MSNRVERSFEVFVVLVNDSFQTVRAEPEAAWEVRDNFNEMFARRELPDVAKVVVGTLTYNPDNVAPE